MGLRDPSSEERKAGAVTAPVFSYEVRIQIEFSTEELKRLMKLSAEHYDSHCRAAGAVGGFLYGLDVQNHFFELYGGERPTYMRPTYMLGFNDLDTLLKICEFGVAQDADARRQLTFRLAEALQALTREWSRLNAL